MATKSRIVGKEVYDKRAGMMGRVLKEDGLSLVIEYSTADGVYTKTVTPTTFRRWYRLLEPAPDEPAPEVKKEEIPKGEVGAGAALYKMFIDIVRRTANQDLDVIGENSKRTVIIKYNGWNVFEITRCRRRLVVMCHPKSLAPSSVAQMTKQYPKEFGWPLSSKFVFTSEAQQPLMRSIINDSLYYRQVIER